MNKKSEIEANVFFVLFFILSFLVFVEFVNATTLTCSFTTSCTDTVLLYAKNDSGGYNNSHVQNASEATYANALCCSSPGTNISYQGCESSVLKLHNISNSHVQQGNYSGPQQVYNTSICASADPGTFTCDYKRTCDSDETCIGSISSSNLSNSNQTDAHLGACNYYSNNICCDVSIAPTVAAVTLTPDPANTTDRFVCTFTISDPDADDTLKVNITWYNGTATYQQNLSVTVTNGTETKFNMTQAAQNKGQTWSCGVIASDDVSTGSQVNSSGVTVVNSPPTRVLLFDPADGNRTTNRTPNFTWFNSSDADEDSLTYQFNLTCFNGCSVDNRIFNVSGSNSTLPIVSGGSTVDDLNFFGDDNFYYNWSVRAYDGEEFGSWSVQRNITIDVLVQITLANDTILFGTKNIGNKDNTTDNNPNPITILNDGNAFIDVNLSTSDFLFDSEPSPSSFYQFKADNVTQQQGSFDYSGSVTTFTNVPETNTTTVNRFNFTATNHTSEVDILIEVPPDEPPGDKSSILTLTGYYLRVD